MFYVRGDLNFKNKWEIVFFFCWFLLGIDFVFFENN